MGVAGTSEHQPEEAPEQSGHAMGAEMTETRLQRRKSWMSDWSSLSEENDSWNARERVLGIVALSTTAVSIVSMCALWAILVGTDQDRLAPLARYKSERGLHAVYAEFLRDARYVDLTHSIHPQIPVWDLFSKPELGPATATKDEEGFIAGGERFTYAAHGFVATSVTLPTDQLGTQLDPPAHWNEFGATISDVPPTVVIRPLVVVDLTNQTAADPGHHASVPDLLAWERAHGRIPRGSAVFFRTDWSARWTAYNLEGMPATFPGVGLEALRFLHLERQVLLHGHEPLDTDMTPSLEGEAWLMHNNFLQASC